jgi:hypothetical protein
MAHAIYHCCQPSFVHAKYQRKSYNQVIQYSGQIKLAGINASSLLNSRERERVHEILQQVLVYKD